MLDIDFITADVDGVVVDSIVDVFKVVVVDAAMVVVAFDLLDDPRGNVFDDLFEEAVVVSLDDVGLVGGQTGGRLDQVWAQSPLA